MPDRRAVRIVPWGDADLPLLDELNSPAMTEHLGGPESAEKLVERQRRYEQLPADEGRMFKIIDEATGEAVGSVGYWDRSWRDERVFEIGWGVLPSFQGHGIAGMPSPRPSPGLGQTGDTDFCTHFRRSRTCLRTQSAESSWLHSYGRVRVRVSEGQLHALQRLAP
jgi:hypothetical protein